MIQPPSALTRAHIVVLLLIVLLGVGMRLYRIDVPLLGIRQNDTAAIARNFAEEEMNIFYPRVDWRGDSPGYVEAELQLYTFAVAWLYRMFGVHEWLGRVLNIGVYAASAWLLFQFGRQVFTARVALFAAFFYSIAPMSDVFTRTFQPDALMSLGALAGVYYFWRWTEDGRPRSWLLSALGVGVAILIKPTNLYFGLPLLYLCYRKFGWRLLRQPSLWLFATATLIPAVVWYAFAWQLWQMYGNTFGILGGWVKVGLPSAGFWLQLGKDELRRVVFQIATPLGVPLLLVGVARRPPQHNYVLRAWLVGLIVAALIAAEGYFEHNYYLLPFVP
ncbi:MAG: glycosyltransferase family 39 protein, partial [Chloroflexi bacterium]|nr:glycosyltransferase family 39 protein [Chloroflexota bacterium]